MDRYNNIEIPEELEFMTNRTINTHRNKKRTIMSTVAAIMIFSLSLNISETFAMKMSEIPLINSFANILTFRDYGYETENIEAEVTIPKVVELEDKKVQKSINDYINERVDTLLEEAEIRAAEYKKAYIGTGGTEEAYKKKKIQVNVDYEILSSHDDILSFAVYTSDTLAAVYAEYIYYNIDLVDDKVLTLEDILGNDFITTITESVKNDVSEQKSNPDYSFFEDIDKEDWTIRDDMDFYINGSKNVVVVFNKYEIAPGAMGRLEYEIITE